MIALLGYPFVFEPLLRVPTQASVWSGIYLLYLLCIGVVVRASARTMVRDVPIPIVASPSDPPPTLTRLVLWICLPAASSALLVSTTTQLCQDIAVIPFLWILPLCLYLLTYVLCFEHERWYVRPVFFAVYPMVLIVACVMLFAGVDIAISWQLMGYCAMLVVGCMLCHGELYRLRPTPSRLTLFYLCTAIGGALGGLLVGIVAPLVLSGLWEYHLSLWLCSVVVAATGIISLHHPRKRELVSIGAVSGLGLFLLSGALYGHAAGWELNKTKESWTLDSPSEQVVGQRRGFFGVVKVTESGQFGAPDHRYDLINGRIKHGMQYSHPDHSWRPTSYYGPDTGLGFALRLHPKRARGGRLRIGAVGLGAGTVASYAKAGDVLRFFEIDPHVAELADVHFSYLRDAKARGADVDILLGDARVVMERLLDSNDPQQFDVLVIDAFSSDAIPIHLLTREATQIYRSHLNTGGVLAFNISNRFLDLRPVLVDLARDARLHVLHFETFDDDDMGIDGCDWVLLTDNKTFIGVEEVFVEGSEMDEIEPLSWTDDFSSLFAVINRF